MKPQISQIPSAGDKNSIWNILIVDDEVDIHMVTKLALRHKRWKDRPFSLTCAESATEAKQILQSHSPQHFQVAVVDVVMETNTAGLDLCKFLRAHYPPSLRIILRTGQAGVAPEEEVLSEYDVDYYLSKQEATQDRLFSLLRASLRSNQDISTLMAFASQLQNFTRALRSLSSIPDLLIFMEEGLAFLELKHGVNIVFWHDLESEARTPTQGTLELTDLASVRATQQVLRERSMPMDTLSLGSELGLGERSYLLPFTYLAEQNGQNETDKRKRGGLYMVARSQLTAKAMSDLCSDALLFIENWKIAFSTLEMQEQLARETMLRERMYFERLESIATMVTGVAHEMGTPLGVANTANSMILELLPSVLNSQLTDEERTEAGADVLEASGLLSKNLTRAHHLIKSFKQLSSSQMVADRTLARIGEVVSDCVLSMTPELRKHQITAEIHNEIDKESSPMWHGFPGYLTQVIVNLLQNTIRYGYKDGGKIDISLSATGEGDDRIFHVVYQDYGHGISKEMLLRIFEPFVTSGRGNGGTGLGLAIVHNIVSNLLGGSITCTSTPGEGAKFEISLPRIAPETAGDR